MEQKKNQMSIMHEKQSRIDEKRDNPWQIDLCKNKNISCHWSWCFGEVRAYYYYHYSLDGGRTVNQKEKKLLIAQRNDVPLKKEYGPAF